MLRTKLISLITLLIGVTFSAHAQPYYKWSKNMGGWANSGERTIITDDSGNVYTTGTYRGTADFDPGSGVANMTSSDLYHFDAYITKLDGDGNFIWAKSMGGSNSDDTGTALSIDPSGNVCILGTFTGTADFDPGSGTTNLTSAGYADVFVVKLDSIGDFIWAKSMEGSLAISAKSIATDYLGNIYSIGEFRTTADFDPGPGTMNLTSTASVDIFISKLDANGNFVWAKGIGGTFADQGNSITVDAIGNVYATGMFLDTVDFDPGPGVTSVAAVGWGDLFVLKLDTNGDFDWVKNVGSPTGVSDVTYGYSIAADAAGDVVIVGNFQGTADFDPGAGTTSISSVSPFSMSIYILKLAANGNFMWARRMGPVAGGAFGKSIATDASGNVYTTGYFTSTVDFDPGPGVANLHSPGCQSIFVSKLDNAGNYVWAEIFGNTHSHRGYSITTDNFGGVFAGGELNAGPVDFDPGPGVANLSGSSSMFLLKLSECLPDSTVTACDEYTWIGTSYFTSGIYTAINVDNDCGPATLTLTINNSTSSMLTEAVCEPYEWNGTTLTTSGTYYWTGTNTQGCDSVATLNFTINTPPTAAIAVSGVTIQSNNVGATYQWLDCNNAFAPIPSETGQFFTPSVNGSYAVQVTENGCSDTSVCYAVESVGIIENSFDNDFTLYPNPTDGYFIIDFNGQMDGIELKISDVSGRKVFEKTYENVDSIEYELDGPKGVYIVEMLDKAGHRSMLKLVKK